MPEVDREGNFQAEIIDYGLKDFESGSVAVSLRVKLTAEWNSETESWDDWTQYDMEAGGDIYIIKKDGKLNDGQVKNLSQYAGWDGSLTSITERTWQPTKCQVSIESDVYKNNTRHRIGFINEFGRKPGAKISTVDAVKAKELEARHGAALRAIVGNARRQNGSSPPASRPASPPPKAAATAEGAPF